MQRRVQGRRVRWDLDWEEVRGMGCEDPNRPGPWLGVRRDTSPTKKLFAGKACQSCNLFATLFLT